MGWRLIQRAADDGNAVGAHKVAPIDARLERFALRLNVQFLDA